MNSETVMSEAELQATVLDLLQAFGFTCHHTYDSRIAPKGRKGAKRTDAGFPDIIAYRWDGKPRALAIELKSEGQLPTKSQRAWLLFFGCQRFEAYVWYPDDLNSGEIERILRGK